MDHSVVSLPYALLWQAGLNASFVARSGLFIAILLSIGIVSGRILKRTLGLPVIAGHIIGGMVAGPSVLNIARWPLFSQAVFLTDHATRMSYSIATSDLCVFFIVLISSVFTVSYLLWIAGHDTDLGDIAHVGSVAALSGVLAALLPIVSIAALLYFFFSSHTIISALGIGVVFAATSVSIPVAMLVSHNKMHLRSSKATLGAAIIDDIFAIILLSGFIIAVHSGVFGAFGGAVDAHHGSLVGALGWMIFAFVVMCAVGYYVVPSVLQLLQRMRLSHLLAPVATIIMLLYFGFTELIGGLSGITGAYFAGLFHRMGDTQGKAEHTIAPFVHAFLLPLFLVSIGLQVDMRLLSMGDWGTVLLILAVATVSKIAGCFVSTGVINRLSSTRDIWSVLESFLFGASMVARGEVGLVVATILRGSGIVSEQQYVICVVAIVLTTVVTPLLLSFGFAWADRHDTGRAEEFTLKVGHLKAIRTDHMFDIILERMEADFNYKLAVQMSEGRKIINLEEHPVEIILSPEHGIIFKGERALIMQIVKQIGEQIQGDVTRFLAP